MKPNPTIDLTEIVKEFDELRRDLVGTLHKELLETDLVTVEQWNKAIAPKLSAIFGHDIIKRIVAQARFEARREIIDEINRRIAITKESKLASWDIEVTTLVDLLNSLLP